MAFNLEQRWKSKWSGKISKIDGITVFKIPGLNWHPFVDSYKVTMGVNLIPGRFKNILKEYDVVHFHEFDITFPFFSYLVKKPKIIHCHGLDVPYLKGNHVIRKLLKHLASVFISVSHQMTNDFLSLGINRDKIAYVPNGVDTQLFKPHGEKDDDLLLFVGRIAPVKGLHVLLKSLHYLDKPIRLVIIGGMSELPKYYSYIMEAIKREKRKGKHDIIYLGARDQADIIKWYQKASILAFPSTEYEALGIVNVESLACETPVVATSVGGVPEVVKDGENGMLIEPNDPISLADKIQYLLDNEEIRKRFGREGRKQVIKDYSLEVAVEKLIKIYKQIIF
jgi:glycosyltransferase involved in cell wall biosynthesis